MMSRISRRQRSQGYLEFGLAIALVALVAMIGLDGIKIGVYNYFMGEGMSRSLNPAPPSGIAPQIKSETHLWCPAVPNGGSGPIDVNVATTCQVHVKDHDTGAPLSGFVRLATSALGVSPTQGDGKIFTIAQPGGGQSDVVCVLDGNGDCTLNYVPDFSGNPLSITPYKLNRHQLSVSYNPGGIVIQSADFTPAMEVKRFTAVAASSLPSCTLAPLPVSQPTTCTTFVEDLDTGTGITPQGAIAWLLTDPAPVGSGTFTPGSGQCWLDVTGSCPMTFTANVPANFLSNPPHPCGIFNGPPLRCYAFHINYDPLALDPFHSPGGLYHGEFDLRAQ